MLPSVVERWLPSCRRLQLLYILVLSILVSIAQCVEDATMIALTLPRTGKAVVEANDTDDSRGYFPLANAVQSAMRLAVDDVNALGSLLEGSLSLAILEVNTVMASVEGLCNALHAVGENGTYGVCMFLFV